MATLDELLANMNLEGYPTTSDLLGNRVGVKGRPQQAYLDALGRAADDSRQKSRLDAWANRYSGEGGKVDKAINPVRAEYEAKRLEALRKSQLPVKYSKAGLPTVRPMTSIDDMVESKFAKGNKLTRTSPAKHGFIKGQAATETIDDVLRGKKFSKSSDVANKYVKFNKQYPHLGKKTAMEAAEMATDVAKKGAANTKNLMGRLKGMGTLKGAAVGILGGVGGEYIGSKIGEVASELVTDKEWKETIKTAGRIGGGIAGSLVSLLPIGRAATVLKIAFPLIGGVSLLGKLIGDDDNKTPSILEEVENLEGKEPEEREVILSQLDKALLHVDRLGKEAEYEAQRATAERQAAVIAGGEQAALL